MMTCIDEITPKPGSSECSYSFTCLVVVLRVLSDAFRTCSTISRATRKHPACKSSRQRAQLPSHVRHALLNCGLLLACRTPHRQSQQIMGSCRLSLQEAEQDVDTAAHLCRHKVELGHAHDYPALGWDCRLEVVLHQQGLAGSHS